MRREKGETDTGAKRSEGGPLLPRVNFRPLLFAAFGLCFGIFLYCRIRFGGFAPSDLLFLLCFLPLSPFPVTKQKILALMCLFLVFATVGAVGIHLYTNSYLRGKQEGDYTVEGTVSLIALGDGYMQAELEEVRLDGDEVSGKLKVYLTSERVRTGDRLIFDAHVSRCDLPGGSADSYDFVNNIRYSATTDRFETGEKGFHPILSFNAALFNLLERNIGGEEGYISYALLTGNARMVDEGFMTAVRGGGIAHIFAVSGLHIGILFAAVMLLSRPLKKCSALPAILVCTLYCALCGWSVSSLRALIMCVALSLNTFSGRKTDMLNSVSLAATATLLFLPAQWLSVGFRLSFGACLGLALFSGSLTRGMKRAHIPRFLREYLSASLSVQLFTFPILIESFGYFSVWGLGLNLIIVPLLPFAFLTLLLCTLLSFVIPPAAVFFLIFPKGLFSVLLFLFAAADFGYVLTGFAFGSAAVAWLCGCFYATERVRLRPSVRGMAACAAVFLFSMCLVAENCLFGGAVVDVAAGEDGMCALVRCDDTNVLILGGTVSAKECDDFLARHTGRVDAAVVLSSEQIATLNVAIFTGAQRVYCPRPLPDGLRETNVICGKFFSVGEFSFVYEADDVLTLFVRGNTLQFDPADTCKQESGIRFEKACGTLKYFLNYGIILLL